MRARYLRLIMMGIENENLIEQQFCLKGLGKTGDGFAA